MTLLELVSTAVYAYFIFSYFTLANAVKELKSNQRDLYTAMRDLYRYKSDGKVPEELDDRIRKAVDDARTVSPELNEVK